MDTPETPSRKRGSVSPPLPGSRKLFHGLPIQLDAMTRTLRSNGAAVLETHRLLRQAIPGQVGELEVKHLGQTRCQVHTDLQESVPQSHRDSEVAGEMRNRA